jgi:hypothetical protein
VPELDRKNLNKVILDNSRLKRIHVNQHRIRSNHKTGERQPVITVKTSKSNNYGHDVHILDKEGDVVATVKYSPDKPLSCGARVWIETRNQIEVVDVRD